MPDIQLLQAALIGYEAERAKIEERISQIRRAIGRGSSSNGVPVVRKTRRLSAAARKRIAAAQKLRWAEYNRRKKLNKTAK